MVRIIVASHGEFAQGLCQSAEMIFGKQENVASCILLPSEGPEAFKAKVEAAIASFEDQDQILFLVDLWGGTPFNQISGLMAGHEDNWAIVSGMNLPMLIEAYFSRNNMETSHEIAKHIISSAKEGIKGKPESVDVAPVAASTAPKANTIPEGTVIGDGKINYVYARVDTRLLHGQVATTWTKDKQPQRIIVASDAVANDELRKSMIIEAAPPGVKVHVIPLDQLVKIDSDPRFGGQRVMVLFETPQEALYTIAKGVNLGSLCLGSMAHSVGKVSGSRALSFDASDVKAVEDIIDNGVKVYVQVVPSEAPEKVEDVLNKVKKAL